MGITLNNGAKMNPQSSGALTTTGGAVAVANGCYFLGANFDHTAAANVIITDTSSGRELCTLRLVGTLAGVGNTNYNAPAPIYCETGVTYDITTGGGCSVIFSR
tara:strand:- start:3845 stop:4156 length:312 start_codon:yes stop_codon:yes gene_type:complete